MKKFRGSDPDNGKAEAQATLGVDRREAIITDTIDNAAASTQDKEQLTFGVVERQNEKSVHANVHLED